METPDSVIRGPLTLEGFNDPEDGSLSMNRLLEAMLVDGIPLFRFADDIPVDWCAIGDSLGKEPGDCKLQLQTLLDEVFGKTEFSESDRRVLAALINFGLLPSLLDSMAEGVGYTDRLVTFLQQNYFRSYSLLTVARETQLALLYLESAHPNEDVSA